MVTQDTPLRRVTNPTPTVRDTRTLFTQFPHARLRTRVFKCHTGVCLQHRVTVGANIKAFWQNDVKGRGWGGGPRTSSHLPCNKSHTNTHRHMHYLCVSLLRLHSNSALSQIVFVHACRYSISACAHTHSSIQQAGLTLAISSLLSYLICTLGIMYL